MINLYALVSIVGIPGPAMNVTAPELGASQSKAKRCAERKKTYGIVIRDTCSEFSNNCLEAHPIPTGNSIQIAEN